MHTIERIKHMIFIPVCTAYMGLSYDSKNRATPITIQATLRIISMTTIVRSVDLREILPQQRPLASGMKKQNLGSLS